MSFVSRIYSIAQFAVLIFSLNARAMESGNSIEENNYGSYLMDTINHLKSNVEDLLMLLNGEFLDIQIVVDQEGLDRLDYELTQKHQSR